MSLRVCIAVAQVLGAGVLGVGPTDGLAADLLVNGVPISVERQILVAKPDQVAALVAQKWRREGGGAKPITDDRTSSLIVLGRQNGKIHETLRLRPVGAAGRIEVIASAIDLSVAPGSVALLPLPLPNDVRIESVVEPLDESGAVTFIGAWQGSRGELMAKLKFAASARGWTQRSAQLRPDGASGLTWWTRGEDVVAFRAWNALIGCRFIALHERLAPTTQTVRP